VEKLEARRRGMIWESLVDGRTVEEFRFGSCWAVEVECLRKIPFVSQAAGRYGLTK
jgi:hypothetical protein